MATLIVAFPKLEEAKAVRNLLVRRGYEVASACTSGAQAINMADRLSDGIIICGYKLSDNMLYSELYEYKPKSFEMLLVASKNLWDDCQDNDIVCAAMPIKVNDLINTIEMMLQVQVRRRKKKRMQPKRRSPQEQKVIDDAKAILMEKNNMTEPEAFRYIQKCSMDSGNTMVESASMVIAITSPCICPPKLIPATSSFFIPTVSSRIPATDCSYQSYGFCSDQPGFGNEIGYSFETVFTTVPCLSISRSFTEEVPKSTPI